MALMVLAIAAGCAVTAIHVDHGLRAGSSLESAVVRAAAERFGATFQSRTVEVGDGPNLEARARSERYAVLPAGVLTGHTADDQAETVLMFLMRGAGPTGLAGIDPATRPLLALRAAETRKFCAELGIDVVDDPSNTDPRFVRNRIRGELLPLMNDIAGRDVAPLIARTADRQRDLVMAIESLADGVDPTDARALASLDRAVASAALRAWWRTVTGDSYSPGSDAVDRMLDVANGSRTSTDVVNGWRLARTNQRLRLERVV